MATGLPAAAAMLAMVSVLSMKPACTDVVREAAGPGSRQPTADTGAQFDPGQVERLEELQNQVAEKLRDELWVRPKVDLVASGSLPVTEGKAKRVIDKRSL